MQQQAYSELCCRCCYQKAGFAPQGLRFDGIKWQISLACAGSGTRQSATGPASCGAPLVLHLARFGLISNLQKLAAGPICQPSQQSASSALPASSAAMDIDSCQQSSSSNGPSAVDVASPADAPDDQHVSFSQQTSTDCGQWLASGNGSQQGAAANGTPLAQGGSSICQQLVQGLMRSYLDAYKQQRKAQRRACVQEMLLILCQPFLHQRYACSWSLFPPDAASRMA